MASDRRAPSPSAVGERVRLVKHPHCVGRVVGMSMSGETALVRWVAPEGSSSWTPTAILETVAEVAMRIGPDVACSACGGTGSLDAPGYPACPVCWPFRSATKEKTNMNEEVEALFKKAVAVGLFRIDFGVTLGQGGVSGWTAEDATAPDLQARGKTMVEALRRLVEGVAMMRGS